MRKVFPFTFLALIAVAAMCPVTAMAQLSGAIFTTDITGTLVNGNIYTDKEAVYLNGGPQNKCSAAGLPDGAYYFQVTDPSGATLLSTDLITDRQFAVLGGVIVSASTHAMGSGKCASVSVQLAPFNDTPNPGGEYKVWATPQSAYIMNGGFLPSASKTDNFKVRADPTAVGIVGTKYYDANVNGVFDPTEAVIPGWKILKSPPSVPDIAFTGINGQYSFLVLPNSGDYTITEVLPTPQWLNTTPLSGIVTVGTMDVAGPDFGNVCLGAGGGLTLGFWSNKNGQSLIGADDLLMLTNLPLVNIDGTPFDPTTALQVSAWLLAGNAVNMANMLSIQLAAMELNVFNGKVNGGAMVYAPGVPGANAFGFISINNLMAAAVAELTAHNTAYAGDAWRTIQEKIKNALDMANNNRTFVQPQPCPFTTPY